MFTPSTLAASAAVAEIADSAGASADSEMKSRALRSLQAATKHFNARFPWYWLQAEASPISVVAPFSVAITAGASGVASATAAANHGVKVDDFVVGVGFAAGTRVSATAATTLGFNATITGITASTTTTITANRDFYDFPSDFRKMYSLRSLTNLKALGPSIRRHYDRAIPDEYQTSTPGWYDLSLHYQKGKIRLLPPPSTADVLQARYYRRMTLPSAVGDTTVLDIPQDYDGYLVAWAKWHFLTDKGNPERATTWLSLAQEGIKTMIADQTNMPDEDLAFRRGGLGAWPGRGDTRAVPWEYT